MGNYPSQGIAFTVPGLSLAAALPVAAIPNVETDPMVCGKNEMLERLQFVSELNENTAKWLVNARPWDGAIESANDQAFAAFCQKTTSALKEAIGGEPWRLDDILWQSARLVHEIMTIAREHDLDIDHGTSSLRDALDGKLYADNDASLAIDEQATLDIRDWLAARQPQVGDGPELVVTPETQLLLGAGCVIAAVNATDDHLNQHREALKAAIERVRATQ